ncbi:MAG: NADH-quinone oxidoreductase subunit C [Bacteroidales bacterium]|nr:NADH-quinone oxidoreductase subunit C [Bacteroidales bacterium]
MERIKRLSLKNNGPAADLKDIPLLDYEAFYEHVADLLNDEQNHCLSYHGVRSGKNLILYCFMAKDADNSIEVCAHEVAVETAVLKSLSALHPAMHIFEREIHENHGVAFEGHPWMKPLRYPCDRHNRKNTIDTYPFYSIGGEELHEVGVGPVHAGVIEPGHFRFICNGEKVLHLEIQLGYQHRGVETLFTTSDNGLQRAILSESVAGDTAVGHALAHSQLVESLAGIEISADLKAERCIALEMERLAIHIGDTAALCGDVAYQTGQVVCEALRTQVINTTQLWCGNRFGKGLVRPGGTNYPLNDDIAHEILNLLEDTGRRFREITDSIYSSPSVLGRFDEIGTLTRKQGFLAGVTGPSARMCGIVRDIRKTHPFQYYSAINFRPIVLDTGDVLARGMIRNLEAFQSMTLIKELITEWTKMDKRGSSRPVYDYKPKPDTFSISLVEGWRGEICHIAMTGNDGKLSHYRVKDPSMHNWTALALAVRNQEISDFPVCNKSFNLSYCGHDL